MGLIPNEIIHQVIDRCDIVEIIGNYTALKKVGRNFKALCPFHNEKTPSFVVNPDKQIFHCFGCGVGGDVVGFIMRQEHLDFPESVQFLGNKAGIAIPKTDTDAASPSRKIRDEIFRANTLAAAFFHEALLKSRETDAGAARDYLKGRGVGLETVKKFQLGFAPNQWDALLNFLKPQGFAQELMLKAGLIVAREGKGGCYDRFRNRVMFPIFDIQNRVVAFGGRAMEASDGAKYINSPETPVYTKGQHLFGLHLARAAVGKLDEVIVVEGYMDMIMPFVLGVENIAASLGTALTVDQIRLIHRTTPNVVMLFDTDQAGQSAIVRSLDLLIDQQMNARVATLSEGQDPDLFIRQYGREAFQKRVDGAQSLLDFKFDWLCSQHDLQTVEGKSKISQEALATIARFNNEVAKYELTKQLARKLNIPEGVLMKQAQKINGSSTLEGPSLSQAQGPLKASAGTKAVEELLLTLFLKDPAWVKAAQGAVAVEDFVDPLMREVVAQILQLSQTTPEWSVSDLLMRFSDEASQSLVTKLISHEEGKLGDVARTFQDCLGRIQKERQKKMRAQLMDAIRQAETNKDEEALDQLKEKFNQLISVKGGSASG